MFVGTWRVLQSSAVHGNIRLHHKDADQSTRGCVHKQAGRSTKFRLGLI